MVDKVLRWAVYLAIIIGVVKVLDYLSPALLPFVAAFLIAYLLHPLVSFLEEKIKSRILAVILVVGFSLSFIIGLAVFVLPNIFSEIASFAKIITQKVDDAQFGKLVTEYLPPEIWQKIKALIKNLALEEWIQKGNLNEVAINSARKALNFLGRFLNQTSQVVTALLGLGIVVLYTVFLLIDFQKVKANWQNLIPPQFRDAIKDFMLQFESAMQNYFRAQIMVASIVGILFALGFKLINLPMAIIMGLFLGLLNIVPYLQLLGMPVAFVLAAFGSLETGQNIFWALGLTAIVFAVVQLIQDGFLIPKLMGKATGLSPAIVLLALSVWGKLLGLFGLLIALPLTCLLLAYYQRWIASQKTKNQKTKAT